MPPKKASATAAAASKSTANTTKAAAKANTSSKRKAADEPKEEQPERRSKRAKTQTKFLEDSPEPEKKAPVKRSSTKTAAAAKKPTTAEKAPAKKAASATKTDAATTSKRGRPSKRATTETEEPEEPEAKKPRNKKITKIPAKPKEKPAPRQKAPPKPAKQAPIINSAPTQRLDVLLCGEGENGELGLGSAKGQTGVKRPRLNPLLSAKDVGVVQVAPGGMHVIALTHDSRILTWGVNDQGTLGRDTSWEGGLRDIDAGEDSDDDSETVGLNPHESTPTAIDSAHFPPGTRFTSVAAGDSCSFAVTDTGFVYGWGTFRANEGILGFSASAVVQRTPILISELKNITSISCGANHVLALDKSGDVFAWGSGQQMQLGRKPVERTRVATLTPRPMGLPKKQITQVACGAYHGFAIDKKDNVWAWGLNNFGECGIDQDAGESGATVPKPTKVPELCAKGVTCIKGGEHHSVAVNGAGDCLVWGRADGAQLGIDVKSMNEDEVIKDEHGRTRIVSAPTVVPQIKGRTKMVTAAGDHTLAVTKDGQAWSWGFSVSYQTGQGTADDIQTATRIENTATREREITWAGAGGQYSVLAAVNKEAMKDADGDTVMN